MIIFELSPATEALLPSAKAEGSHQTDGPGARWEPLHAPDFLPILVVSPRFMRLSSMKAAHPAVDKAA
jgi:hypothetical protein